MNVEHENAYLQNVAQIRLPKGLVSRAPRYKAVIEEVGLVAPTATAVLLLGETGSGKESVAGDPDQRAAGEPDDGQGQLRGIPASLIEANVRP